LLVNFQSTEMLEGNYGLLSPIPQPPDLLHQPTQEWPMQIHRRIFAP
jgi:hypothetical protein